MQYHPPMKIKFVDKRSHRLGLIIKCIANNPGITLTQLHAQIATSGLTVSERTIAKDIDSLKNEFALLPKKGRLRQGYSLSDVVTIGQNELAIVTDALNAFAIALTDADAQTTVDRITESIRLGPLYSSTPKRLLGQRVIVNSKKSRQKVEALIMTSVSTATPLQLAYASPRTTGVIKLNVYPLFKVFYQRAWYLIVKDLKTKAYHPCRIDRIEEAQSLPDGRTNQTFIEDVHEARYLINCGWGMTFPQSSQNSQTNSKTAEIIVRFDRSVAPYIQEGNGRHPLAKIEAIKDGTGDLLFTIKLDDPWEFRQWVRSFGSNAWFVASESIIDSEKADLIRLAQRYGLRLVK